MTNFQRGYGEYDIGTGGPTISHRFAADYAFDEPEKITVKDADTKAHRAFVRGTIFGGCVIAALMFALPAFADTLNISGSLISLEPSDEPGAIAQISFHNVSVNDAADNGDYPLASADMTLTIQFLWEVNLFGADQITVVPPPWVICQPIDCTATVMEGEIGVVVLYPYEGA